MSGQVQVRYGIRAVVSTRPSNRKLLLIEVAETLFATLGFDGTTVREIASRAEVPVHAVYQRFGSKAGLLKEIEAARVHVAQNFTPSPAKNP
ncbi:MAG: helix-turn-helix domain-containing protein [Pseudomonadota bacterium]